MSWIGRRLHKLGLFGRLLILGAIIFSGVLALVTYVTREATHSLEQRTMQEMLASAKVVATSLDEVIRQAVSEFNVSATDVASHLDNPDAVRSRLIARSLATRESGAFTMEWALFDSDGQLLAYSPENSEIDYGQLSGLANSAALAAGPELIPRQLIPPAEYHRVAISKEISNPIDGARYTLLGLLNPLESPLTDLLNSAVESLDTGHAELLDAKSRVVTSTEIEHENRTLGDHPDYYQSMRMSDSVGIDVVAYVDDEDGDSEPPPDHVMAYVPLKRIPWAIRICPRITPHVCG